MDGKDGLPALSEVSPEYSQGSSPLPAESYRSEPHYNGENSCFVDADLDDDDNYVSQPGLPYEICEQFFAEDLEAEEEYSSENKTVDP